MAKLTNYTAGPRGVNVKGKGDNVTTKWIEPGQTLELADGESVHGDAPDLGKPADQVDDNAASLAEANATIADLKAQIAALTKPKLPGLTGKSKDQLAQIAADEGVTIADGATANDMIAAIEAKREGDAG